MDILVVILFCWYFLFGLLYRWLTEDINTPVSIMSTVVAVVAVIFWPILLIFHVLDRLADM